MKKYQTLYLSHINGKEADLVQLKREMALHEGTDFYPEYGMVSLKGFLELKTSSTFPFTVTEVKGGGKAFILAYFSLMGHKVYYEKTPWTEDQLKIIGELGIVVVNAGPGTGKTTTANEKAYRLKDEGVLLLSYSNEAIKENYKRMYSYAEIKGLIGMKDYTKNICVTTVDSLSSFILGSQHEEGFDSTVKSSINHMISQKGVPKLQIPGQDVYKYRHLIVDECQDVDDMRGRCILEFYKRCRCLSLTLFGDPRQTVSKSSGSWYHELWSNGTQTRVGLTESYRFKSPQTISLVNSLSERRGKFHHSLTSHPTTQDTSPPIQMIQISSDDELNEVGLYVRDVLESIDVAVIGHSFDSSNRVGEIGRKIYTQWKEIGLKCVTRSEGSFEARGINFSTISSVKGKEFDYVFLYGMDSYPSNFSAVPYEQAESLIFVAHSRARLKMFYLNFPSNDTREMMLPRGIGREWIDGELKGELYTSQDTKPGERKYTLSDLISCSDFKTLLKYNSFRAEADEEEGYHFIQDIPQELLKDVGRFDHEKIHSLYLSGYQRENYEDSLISFTYISAGGSVIGSNELEVLISSSLLGRDGYILRGGLIHKLKCDKTPDHWKYIISSYLQIRREVNLTNYRLGKVMETSGRERVKIDPNLFTVDTEFTGFKDRQVFEISIINVANPFMSILQTLRVSDMKFATEWSHLPESVFTSSLCDVKDLFFKLSKEFKGTCNVGYYVERTDIAWMDDRHTSFNIGPKAREEAAKVGYYISGSQPPKLTDLYSTFIEPCNFLPHLKPHTSVTDALMLRTLLILGHI
jgi:hypothetical protein